MQSRSRWRSKADGSPVTKADAAAERIILAGLKEAFPGIYLWSPRNPSKPAICRDVGDIYFLVDPLDGTKEFLKKNGEFTVNIALIEKGVPVFGVVSAPALGEIYWGELSVRLRKPVEQRAFKASIADGSIAQIESGQGQNAAGWRIKRARKPLSSFGRNIGAYRSAECCRTSIGGVVAETVLGCCRAGRTSIRVLPRPCSGISPPGDAVVRAAGGAVVLAADGTRTLCIRCRKMPPRTICAIPTSSP